MSFMTKTMESPGWFNGLVRLLAIVMIILQIFLYFALAGDPPSELAHYYCFFTVWFVLFPVLFSSVLRPYKKSRIFPDWRMFCYVFSILTVAHIFLMQYFLKKQGDIPGLPWAIVMMAPLYLGIVSALSALFISKIRYMSPGTPETQARNR